MRKRAAPWKAGGVGVNASPPNNENGWTPRLLVDR